MIGEDPSRSDAQHKANDWLARELGGLNSKEQKELKKWLDLSVENRAAYDKARQIWQLSRFIERPHTVSPALNPSHQHASKPWVWSGFCVATLLVVLSLLFPHTSDYFLLWQSDYLAQAGEVKEIELPDGSKVKLASRSALKVNYTDKVREINLLSGEAIFFPKPLNHLESRPFQVIAASSVSKALGTVFHVKHNANKQQVQTVVLEHSVEFYDFNNQSIVILNLSKGEAAGWNKKDLVFSKVVDFQEVASWRNGALVFKNRPLSYVLEQLNHFRKSKMVLLDDDHKDKKITAILQLDDIDSASDRMLSRLALTQYRLGNTLILY